MIDPSIVREHHLKRKQVVSSLGYFLLLILSLAIMIFLIRVPLTDRFPPAIRKMGVIFLALISLVFLALLIASFIG